MDILGTVFITVLATYMVYFREQGSSSIGFSLNMACVLHVFHPSLILTTTLIQLDSA
jgi:hypothetical protein